MFYSPDTGVDSSLTVIGGSMAETHKADLGYSLAGLGLACVGWIVGTNLVSQDPTFKAAAGISVFALVYVLAQGVERVVELVLSVIDSMASKAGKEVATTTKAKALKAVAAAPPATAASADKEKALSAESDTHALAFGLALGIAFIACGYFEVGLLGMIGVTGMESWVDRLTSGLIIAGGSKPLHDLISKIEKSKQKDEQSTGA